jgi:hypothetical protein
MNLELQAALIESNRAAASAEVKAAAQNIHTQLKGQFKASSATFVWKGKGNEAQHIWNCELLNTVLEAAACSESDDLEGAKKYIEKGMREILFRNKLIKLADGSPAGWGLVEEYLKNSLADDDTDDRKIRKCEQVALEKKKRRIEESTNKRGRGGGQKGGKPRAELADRVDNTDNVGDGLLSQFPWSLLMEAAKNFNQTPTQGHTGRKLGPCYICGGPHLQNACPILRGQQAAAQAQLAANVAQAPGNSKN